MGMELRANSSRLEVAQRLSNAVINLWNKMHDNSEVAPLTRSPVCEDARWPHMLPAAPQVMNQRPLTDDDIPVKDPLHMVQCIYELMAMHSVKETGARPWWASLGFPR